MRRAKCFISPCRGEKEQQIKQEEIHNIDRVTEWKIEFSTDKCEVTHRGRTNPDFRCTVVGSEKISLKNKSWSQLSSLLWSESKKSGYQE